MSSSLAAVTFEAQDPAGVAAFWGSLLDRTVVPEPRGALLPGSETQVGVRFVAPSADSSDAEWTHLHLTSASPEEQRRTVETALALGARHLDVGQLPEEEHIVLGDPGGNAFCVIEAGNNFLADCGFLAETACEGSREVGLFWRDALGWALVWDQDGETAIQSPAGGTKLAWGGPAESPEQGRNRQRFDLVTADLAAEVARLVGLGATRLADRDGGIELADPDGNEFWIAADQTRRDRPA